jgi:tetratricopeptide (TPR) repeat protein
MKGLKHLLIFALLNFCAVSLFAQENAEVTKALTEGIAKYEKLVKEQPDSAGVHNVLATYYLYSKDFQKSFDTFQKAIKLSPENYTYYNNTAVVLFQANKLEEAKAYATKALSLNPLYSPAYSLIGSAYMKQNNLLVAKAYFEKALSLNSNDADARVELAKISYQEAKNYYQEAQIINPKTKSEEMDKLFK